MSPLQNECPVIERELEYPTYEDFFQANWLRVVRYLQKKGTPYADAEDIASQAFLYCSQRWEQYDVKKSSQSTWLFMVVRSRWINYCKARKDTVDIDLLSNVLVDGEDLFEMAAELDDLRQRLADALKALSSDQRRAIIFRFFDNRNDESIAQILNTSPGNVRVIIFRALKKLKAHMHQTIEKENL